MMKIKYSSDARVILATSFPVFKEIVLSYSDNKKAHNDYMFDQQQLDDVYLSPHHIFLIKDIARVGVKLLEFRKQISDLRNDLLVQEQIILQAVEQLKERVSSGKLDIKIAKEAEKKLIIQNEKVQDSLRTVNQLLDTEVKRLIGEFDNLMAKHDEEWGEHRTYFIQELAKQLEEKNMLFAYEKEKLLRQDNIRAILDEFRD